jgi:histidinol-phosphate/aromatic aminotransferase/cobyric acid decarboxylase-like protein
MSTEVEKGAAARSRAHGGLVSDELARLGIAADEVLDFSVSVNPYGPSAAVAEAIRAARLERYPDPSASAARRAIAAYHGTSPDRVVVGNGSADLLWTLARVLLAPGTSTIVVEPTFAEFREAALFQRARLHEWRAVETDAFAVHLDAVSALARRVDARVVYICSPNTPTGTVVPAAAIAAFAEDHPQRIIVLDHAFITLSEAFDDERAPFPRHVVQVRSLTKDHAIPALRVGYLVAPESLAARLEAARPAWTTSGLAEQAVIAAMTQATFVAESRRRMLVDRDRLVGTLSSAGLRPMPSAACFVVVPVGSGRVARSRLLQHRIMVRDCTSFGLPGFIRIAARPARDVERLAWALGKGWEPC